LRARKKSGDLTTAIVPAGTSFPAVLREPFDLVIARYARLASSALTEWLSRSLTRTSLITSAKRLLQHGVIAAEFVRVKVDVIVTAGPPVFAAKQATSVIPIVFATVADPLSTGLVASLARPGGNITGLSLTSPELAGKRLELLREVIPGLRQLAIMANADYRPSIRELDGIETAARPLGVEIIALKIRQA